MVDDKGDFEPSEFFVQLGMLILESRLPSTSIKGRQDGPHCPRDVGMWSGHICESTNSQCTRANQILKQMQTLWRNQVPLCIEVLILPSCQHGRQKSILTDVTPPYEDDGYVLLEQWTIQTVQKKSGETHVSPKTLFQALKSYLHFSQLSSWLSSSQGSKPPSIGYRVSPPAEFCTTTFTRDPQLHVFPISCINKSTNFKVWLAYLSRMPEIPEPICYELSKDGQSCSKSGKCTTTIDGTNKKRVSRSKSPRPRYEAVFQNIKGSPKLVSKSCNNSSSVKRHQPNLQSSLASIYESQTLNKNSYAVNRLNSSSSSREITLPVDTNSKDDAYGIGLSDHRLCHEGRTLKRSRPLSKNLSNHAVAYDGVSVAEIENGVSNMNFSSKMEPNILSYQQQGKSGKCFMTSDNCEHFQCNFHQLPLVSDDNNVAVNFCLKDTCRSFNKIKACSSLDSLLNSDLERAESPRPQASFCPIQKVKTKKDVTDHQKSLADSRSSSAIDIIARNECSTKRRNSPPARVFLKDQYLTDSDTSCSPDLDYLLSETLGKRELPLNPQEMSDCLFQIYWKKQLQSNRIIPFSSKSRYYADPSRKFHCEDGDQKMTNKIIGDSNNLIYRKNFDDSKSRKLGDLSNFVIKKRVPSGLECRNASKINKVHEYKKSQVQPPNRCDNNLVNESQLDEIKSSHGSGIDFSQSKKSKSCSCFMNEFESSVCCTCMEAMNVRKTLQILNSIKKQNKAVDVTVKKSICHHQTDVLESNFYLDKCEKSKEKQITNRSGAKNETFLKPIFSVGEEDDDEVFSSTCESDELDGITGKRSCEKATISDEDNNCRKKISKSLSINTSSSIHGGAASRHKSLACHSNDVSKPPSTFDLDKPSIYEHDHHHLHHHQSNKISPVTTPPSCTPSQRILSKTPQENLSAISPLLNFVLKQKVNLENSSDLVCNDSINNKNGTICKKDLQFKTAKVPSEKEKSGFKVRVQHSSSMVFNANTKLPMQSSPVPAKRLSSGCFDYDSSLNSVQAIKNSLSCNNLDDQENSNGGSNRLRQALSTSAPASTNCLLGSFEESLINGRIEPAGVIDGFTADIGASGSFCPSHLTLPCLAFFFSLSDDSAPSPYLGHINLESHSKRGYRVPNKGTVQVTLFNPNKSVVKIFVAAYDVSDMPANHQTLLRQRTLYMPTPGSPSDVPGAPVYLRYLIHLRFASSKQNKVYLHTDIRLIFARDKFELDSRIYHYELRSFNEAPENPKYSPRR